MQSSVQAPSLHTFLQDLEPMLMALGQKLCTRGYLCATAESCTGGLVGAACTSVNGASAWFAGGIIAYENSVKTALLGVPAACIDAHGAVSREVVCHMAHGACKALRVPVAVAVSGIAGPTGGTPDKPVGTVWLAFAIQEQSFSHCLHLHGDREHIRQEAVTMALRGLVEHLS